MEINVIGKPIKECRLLAKLTQKELAAKVGVSHAAISFWENGVNIPNVEDCWKMADALHVSIDELIGRTSCLSFPHSVFVAPCTLKAI